MQWIVFSVVLASIVLGEKLPPSCSSDIYCYGELLDTVQMARIYADSKTFVDMKQKQHPKETQLKFKAMMDRTSHKPTRDDVEKFLADSFEDAGSEFEDWEPTDWVENPAFLGNVKDRSLQEWGSTLNSLWKLLGRKMKPEVEMNPDQYSIIYVPNPVIVPGGRFREFYYWDSYWIVRGLLYSEMTDTVRGMLENFVSVVLNYGFIPNGGRLYYAMRSQPPLLIPMVESYIEFSKDESFLKENIDVLEQEFQFWMKNRTVDVTKDGKTYNMAIYRDSSSGPRPESYREDVRSGNFFKTDEEKDNYYSELKSAAESGWDFSSRWFVNGRTNKGNLTNLSVKQIVPADLNAILHWNAKLLAKFYTKLGMESKAKEYQTKADELLEAISAVLWNEKAGTWFDYDRVNQISREYFFPSNLAPLWTESFHSSNKSYYVSKVLKYLEKMSLSTYLGGVPTSFDLTGEQWDFPNSWPPLQYIMIMGLDKTDDDWAKDLAYEISEKWVLSNFKGFKETNCMYEKYDSVVSGAYGGGGEYEVQVGFGWTNGIILELLSKYGDRLVVPNDAPKTEAPSSSVSLLYANSTLYAHLFTLLSAFGVTVSAGCIGLFVYSRRHPSKYIKVPQF